MTRLQDWNRSLGVGAIAADGGVRWLDATGQPVGDFLAAPVFGNHSTPDIGPTANGFLVVAPANNRTPDEAPPGQDTRSWARFLMPSTGSFCHPTTSHGSLSPTRKTGTA